MTNLDEVFAANKLPDDQELAAAQLLDFFATGFVAVCAGQPWTNEQKQAILCRALALASAAFDDTSIKFGLTRK